MSAIAANSTSPVWFYCELADLYCAHRQNYDCASRCTGVEEIPAPPVDLGAIDSLDDRDYYSEIFNPPDANGDYC